MNIFIPESHPRAASLKRREQLIEACHGQIVAYAGLIAHGRGEAFDYLLGEKTQPIAAQASKAACARLLLASHPVLSVNGNLAALCPAETVALAQACNAQLEINLFYRTPEREQAIKAVLEKYGATGILGVNPQDTVSIPELQSARRIVDRNGIFKADVVLVPLEDGDRTEALVKMGKTVITIDLNPLSRTARHAHITIVDDVERALRQLSELAVLFKKKDTAELQRVVSTFNNQTNLADALEFISRRLSALGKEPERI